MNWLLSDHPCNIRNRSKDANSDYDVVTAKSMTDAVMFCKQVWIRRSPLHLFCSAYQSHPWHKVLSGGREVKATDSDEGESSSTEKSEAKKRAGFKV